jgi:hypothetical protein
MIRLVGNGYDFYMSGEQINVPANFDATQNIHITMDGSFVTTIKEDLLGLGRVPHWARYLFTFNGLCETARDTLIAFIKSIGFSQFELTSDVTGTTEARFVGNVFDIVNNLRVGGATVSLEIEAKDANSPGIPPTAYITEQTLDTMVTEDVEDILVKED